MPFLTVIWIFLSIVVGFLGRKARMGFWGNFILALFLSPVVAVIIVYLTTDNVDMKGFNLKSDKFFNGVKSEKNFSKKKFFDFEQPLSEDNIMDGAENLSGDKD